MIRLKFFWIKVRDIFLRKVQSLAETDAYQWNWATYWAMRTALEFDSSFNSEGTILKDTMPKNVDN